MATKLKSNVEPESPATPKPLGREDLERAIAEERIARRDGFIAALNKLSAEYRCRLVPVFTSRPDTGIVQSIDVVAE